MNHDKHIGHELEGDIFDQTLGVVCLDCKEVVAWCWAENHIPESLWNRVCLTDPTAKPCEQSRDDFCALCKEKF